MSDEKLDAILKNQEELARHLLNTQTDIDDQEQAFTLIQQGFMRNVDAMTSIARDLAMLKERLVTTLVLAGVVPAIVMLVGVIVVAGKVLELLRASPAAMAVLGFSP